MDFALLDLAGTFKFVEMPNLSAIDKKRFEYTFIDVLQMDSVEREPVREAREAAYGDFYSRLFTYVSEKNSGASKKRLQNMIKEIQSHGHITVWKEMQRYYLNGHLGRIDKSLDNLFKAEPDAVNW
jgi:hypothetical protein